MYQNYPCRIGLKNKSELQSLKKKKILHNHPFSLENYGRLLCQKLNLGVLQFYRICGFVWCVHDRYFDTSATQQQLNYGRVAFLYLWATCSMHRLTQMKEKIEVIHPWIPPIVTAKGFIQHLQDLSML